MSILIKGVEMPKSCHCCRMCVQVSDGDIDWHWECCLLADKVERYAAERIPGCPLVSVPAHGRLIDADALYEDCALDHNYEVAATTTRINEYMQLKIDAAPTIIPASGGEEDE